MFFVKYVPVALAVMSLVTGLIAAYLWLLASQVNVDPGWGQNPLMEPVDDDQKSMAWIVGMLKASTDSARLNKFAARWTAASVILGGLSSTVGNWPLS